MKSSDVDSSVRKHLVSSLRGGEAFESPRQIIDEVPEDKRFVALASSSRSPWQIIEHMRLSLEDIAAYIDNADGGYKSLNWPEDYWPESRGKPEDWDQSVESFFHSLRRVEDLVLDEGSDLLAPFPWSKGHTLLREALLAIEHTAYHCGELAELTMAWAN